MPGSAIEYSQRRMVASNFRMASSSGLSMSFLDTPMRVRSASVSIIAGLTFLELPSKPKSTDSRTALSKILAFGFGGATGGSAVTGSSKRSVLGVIWCHSFETLRGVLHRNDSGACFGESRPFGEAGRLRSRRAPDPWGGGYGNWRIEVPDDGGE